MADVVSFFMSPEDEVAFFRALEPMGLTLLPEIVPAGLQPAPVTGDLAKAIEGTSYYLAAERLAPVEVREIERGPNRGSLEVDEIRSPVIHYERSVREGQELRSGRLWAELVVSGDTRENVGKSEAFRQLFERIRTYLKRFRRSQPIGVFIGPGAARLFQMGVKLRGAGRKGEMYRPFR
ncbi:MAG TPA: hypothetical protein VMB50_02385 [Myxococcales bacterium]|nr:hypothetical protein [Myxococcales bacterium]